MDTINGHNWMPDGFCSLCQRHATDWRTNDICAVALRLANSDNDSDAIDTDLEDQRAELLQEMAEEEHHCLEADEALSGMRDA